MDFLHHKALIARFDQLAAMFDRWELHIEAKLDIR